MSTQPSSSPLRFLVAESEPPEARARRRQSVGKSAGETYVDVLQRIAPDARCDRVKPADAGAALPDMASLRDYDAVFLSGSPLHLWQDSPEVRRELEFMRAVFASGTPSFGSCAGLQVATVAAGGKVRPMAERREAGFARRLHPVGDSAAHPMLSGRSPAWDAPAIHTDEVERLPDGAILVAANEVTIVQAAEIRFEGGLFWGTQYHPELSLVEVAAALRRQADDLIEHKLARSSEDVEEVAITIDALAAEPDRADLLWRLGLSPEIAAFDSRSREIRNFIDQVVKPRRGLR